MEFGAVERVDEHIFQWTIKADSSSSGEVNEIITYRDFEWKVNIQKFYTDAFFNGLVVQDYYAVRCFMRPKSCNIAKNNLNVYHQSYFLRFRKEETDFWAVQVKDQFPMGKRLWIPGKLIHVKGFNLQKTLSDTAKYSFQLMFAESSLTQRSDGDEKPVAPYNDVDHLSDCISKLLLDDEDSDVTITVGKKKFKAHQNILKCRSEKFKILLEGEGAEEIEIFGCNPEAFDIYLRYVYSGKLCKLDTHKTALGLYYIADKYDAKVLSKHSIQYLINNLDSGDLYELALFAARHSEDLLEAIVDYSAKNFKQMCSTEQWKDFIVKHPVVASRLIERVYDYLLKYM